MIGRLGSHRKERAEPIELLVKDGSEYRTVRIDYRGGLRHPTLERIEATQDWLTPILSAR